MAAIDDQINAFLRDASYRVAELTIEIDEKKNTDKKFKEEAELRAELTTFMDLLYDSINPIKDDYTFLKQSWPEREIIAEMEYLRGVSEMAEIPYITFTGYSPQVITQAGDDNVDSTMFPPGFVGQIMTYNISGDVVVVDFPSTGGMKIGETIDDYFG